MKEVNKSQKYDLEDRTQKFAKSCRVFLKRSCKGVLELDDAKQLIRSSGSVAANYIEANEALSKKDFLYRIKICRKEAKESEMWLKLLSDEYNNQKVKAESTKLSQEAYELRCIFGAIVTKTKK